MKLSLRFLILLFIISGAYSTSAQDEIAFDTSKNIILYKERTLGFIFHSQGWGLKYSKGYNKTAFNKRSWTIEFVEMQSPKQIRTINPYFTNSKSFIYGKLNAVFVLRGAYGNYKQLNRKPYWGGVEVRLVYMGGVSLGLAKPVYLNIYNINNPGDGGYIVTTVERYDPEKHFLDNIYGRASFTKGFNQIGFYPGFNAKIGLDFDYASYRNKVKSLEIGAIIDIFPRAVPIMAYNDPNYFFLTFYLNFNFGKRFN